jgi:predicted nucleic acid-binding protein
VIFIVDTNVLSELMRPSPDPVVVSWMAARPAARIFTTAVTQAEILLGLALMPAGRRRNELSVLVEEMFERDLKGRILPFDAPAASIYARFIADRRRQGHPVTAADAQIAAIAESRGGTLVTRNVADFAGIATPVLDPWIPS